MKQIEQPAACALAAPVAWPCEIEEADFERGVVRLKMRCADYKVGAGLHWLHTAPQPAKREQEPVEIEMPEYHSHGMGCGLEDRGITDRYEAMEYGWYEAIDRVKEELANFGPLYTAPQPRRRLTDEEIDNTTRKQVDDLLDHIYEYGTAAEGIIERVRAIARAIERAHGIGEHE